MAAASEIVKIRNQARREMRDPTDLRGEKLGIREKLGLHEDVRLYDSIKS